MSPGRGARSAGTVLAATSVLIVGLVATPSASADTLPPNLNGQNMQGFDTWGFADRTAGQCDPDGPTTFSFTTSGTTAGPYPGTFTEQVTAVVEPDPAGSTVTQYGVPVPASVTTEFHATFTITSALGTVTGTKDLLEGYGGPATCAKLTGTATYDGRTYADATVVSTSFQGGVTYQATIDTATGTYTDSGRGSVYFTNTGLSAPGIGAESDGFFEFFSSSQPVVPLGPASVALTPPDAVNLVGTSHTVTATVANAAGATVSGTTVLFSVAGSVTTAGSCVTDAGGQCSFTYQGPDFPGADEITACADSNGNGAVEVGEPCNTATKAWILPTTTAGQVTGGGQVLNADASDKIAFGFNARSTDKGIAGACNLVDSSTDTKITCLDVTTLTQAGNTATFFGNATIDGTPTTYRIDVVDNGEPGTTDTFRIRTASGYTAGGVLTGGNIQTH